MASAFAARGAGSFPWRLLIGAIYILGGLYLAFNPRLALESLTLAMALMFFFEGVLETRRIFPVPDPARLWMVSFRWSRNPVSRIPDLSVPAGQFNLAIGTILGTNLITSGFTRLMYSVAVRRTLDAIG